MLRAWRACIFHFILPSVIVIIDLRAAKTPMSDDDVKTTKTKDARLICGKLNFFLLLNDVSRCAVPIEARLRRRTSVLCRKRRNDATTARTIMCHYTTTVRAASSFLSVRRFVFHYGVLKTLAASIRNWWGERDACVGAICACVPLYLDARAAASRVTIIFMFAFVVLCALLL